MSEIQVHSFVASFHNNASQFFYQFFKQVWFVGNEYYTSEPLTISSILFLLSFENYFMVIFITCLTLHWRVGRMTESKIPL